MTRRFLISAVVAMLGGWVFATPDPPGSFRFRLGPFLEWGSRDGAVSRVAVRPFFAWERSVLNHRDRDMEVVWPLTHFAWRSEGYHNRIVLAFWNRVDVTGQRSRDYSLAIPPIWAHGRDEGKNYWGLFPIWGRLPRFFLTEDFRWGLFPLWLSYRTGGSRSVRRDYILWPLFSLKHDPSESRWALWPLYGTKQEPDFDSRFILWPFWNDQTFHAKNHRGTAWMLWPIMERINADTEQGYGLIPPLFRWSWTTDGAWLLRCPWPLFERYRDPRESTWKSWRFWGMTHRGSRDGWWCLYPIMLSQRQRTENVYNRVFRVWPFYVDEESHGYDIHGRSRLRTSHFRIWPFFAVDYDEQAGMRYRSLVLFPIRDVPAVERNWAPFWTFYSATQRPDSNEVLHELFWGLIWWRTHPEPYAERRALREETP